MECDEQLDPNENDPKVHLERGQACYEAGDYEPAVLHFSRAIELDPKYVDAYNNRGNAYGQIMVYDLAIKDFDRAIELKPNNSLAYASRGFAYAQWWEDQRAIQDYSRAIEVNPKYTQAYYHRGLSYYYLDQYTKAIKDFSQAIELDRNHTMAYFWRGIAYRNLGQQELAVQDHKWAMDLYRQNKSSPSTTWQRGAWRCDVPWLCVNVALNAILGGRFDEAIEIGTWENELLYEKTGADNAGFHEWRAWACQLKGDEDCAESELALALALDPDLAQKDTGPYNYSYWATYLSVLLDFDGAIKTARFALRLHPDDRNDRAALGQAYAWAARARHPAGDYKKALEYLDGESNALERAAVYYHAAFQKHPVGDYSRALTELTAYNDQCLKSGYEKLQSVFCDISLTLSQIYYLAALDGYPAGDYGAAVAKAYLGSSESDWITSGSHSARGRASIFAALARHPAGDYAAAISSFGKAIDMCKERYGNTRCGTTDLYQALDELFRALQILVAGTGRTLGSVSDTQQPVCRIVATSSEKLKALVKAHFRDGKDILNVICPRSELAVHYAFRGLSHLAAASSGHPAGDLRQALDDANQSIELAPDVWVYYLVRAEVCRALGDNTCADADLTKARELGF